MRQFWLVISFIYLAIAQSEIDFPPSDLELDNNVSAPPKNKTKTWGTIFPGTKWCGQGNKAKHEEDFGKYRLTDMCCKQHDRCPEKIKGGMTKYGLTNNGSTTLLSCDCDEQFFDCLKRTRTMSSKTIGILYFDILKRPCFTSNMDDYPDSNLYKWTHTRPFSSSKIVRFISKLI
ncbi:phospholipase A2-like [Chelonus insularis]|uniref:phospholipase A2-like n=1 Tax=Chelonus insularis TaxID=460826 RepID=UPI00158E983B|nr:phospholipase A2-like [Chelonus insularis]XP_034943087.1 phospholipase A2-like [Chelonus insularis]